MANLNIHIGPIELKNPTLLASGILDEDAGIIQRMSECGPGAIVTKSIGMQPNEGYANPTILELEFGLLNAMGLPNPGINLFEQEMKKLKKLKISIIGSIYGSNTEEFVTLAKKMKQYGARGIELNVSCPHAKRYGLEIGCDASLVHSIVNAIKKQVQIPIFVKLSPNTMNIIEIAKSVESAKADAIVAINTVKGMKIDLDTMQPILSNKIGGYSGKAIKPIGIRCVYEIAQSVKIPVIGVGGITTGEDAIEYFMAGASAIQIGSAVYYRGPEVFKYICKEIKIWMDKHGYKKINEFIGAAYK